MSTITSRDGTTIAYERSGKGPPLVLVDGAMSYRAFGPLQPVAEVLAADFTVYAYDRRGRGESGDTAPYAVAREVEDLEALIAVAGGSAHVYGVSSGAALAMEAAASGAPITRLALFEPPYTVEGGDDAQLQKEDSARLQELLAADRRSDAVEAFFSFFMPAEAIAEMRGQPVWPLFEAVAPTLGYDFTIMDDGLVPRDRAARVGVPTLVLDGGDSPEVLRSAAQAVAAAIPGARYRTLEGRHDEMAPEITATALREFLL